MHQVEWRLSGIGNKVGREDFKGWYVITANMDVAVFNVIYGAKKGGQEDNTIYARKFTPVGVSVEERARDYIDSSDGIVLRVDESEGWSAKWGFKGAIAYCSTSVGDDGISNVRRITVNVELL
jgi:hypothetical protein